MDISVLRPVFYGVVSADKVVGERIIKAKVVDLLPNQSGEVDDSTETLEIEITTPEGKVKKKLEVGDFVTASWLNRNSNRLTSPNVMKGERVVIWRDGNSAKYYWEATDLDNHLRTVEQIIFAISNTNPSDRKDKSLTIENCHFIEFNTIGKFFRIVTNKNQEEPFAYEFLLQMAEGFFKFKDDKGMHALFDSTNDVIDLINHHKTHYRMDKEDILEECYGHRVVKVGKTNTVEIGETNSVKVGSDETYEVGASSTRKVVGVESTETKDSYLKTNSHNVKSSVNNFNTPQSNFSGNVAMASFVVGMGMGASPAGGYNGTITGNFKVNGDMVGSGVIDTTTGKFSSLTAGSASFGSHGPH